jgi:hypothetical protein
MLVTVSNLDPRPEPVSLRAGVVRAHSQESPATVFSPLVGLEIALPGGEVTLPASEGFEYGVLAADGPAAVGCPAVTGAPARVEGCSRTSRWERRQSLCRRMAPAGFSSSAACHSESGLSCGGISSPAPPNRS